MEEEWQQEDEGDSRRQGRWTHFHFHSKPVHTVPYRCAKKHSNTFVTPNEMEKNKAQQQALDQEHHLGYQLWRYGIHTRKQREVQGEQRHLWDQQTVEAVLALKQQQVQQQVQQEAKLRMQITSTNCPQGEDAEAEAEAEVVRDEGVAHKNQQQHQQQEKQEEQDQEEGNLHLSLNQVWSTATVLTEKKRRASIEKQRHDAWTAIFEGDKKHNGGGSGASHRSVSSSSSRSSSRSSSSSSSSSSRSGSGTGRCGMPSLSRIAVTDTFHRTADTNTNRKTAAQSEQAQARAQSQRSKYDAIKPGIVCTGSSPALLYRETRGGKPLPSGIPRFCTTKWSLADGN